MFQWVFCSVSDRSVQPDVRRLAMNVAWTAIKFWYSILGKKLKNKAPLKLVWWSMNNNYLCMNTLSVEHIYTVAFFICKFGSLWGDAHMSDFKHVEFIITLALRTQLWLQLWFSPQQRPLFPGAPNRSSNGWIGQERSSIKFLILYYLLCANVYPYVPFLINYM